MRQLLGGALACAAGALIVWPVTAVEEKVIRTEGGGALVWRPYEGRVHWTGSADSQGFATGPGTLTVCDRQGNVVAIFEGTMEQGRLGGLLSARYPRSPDRAAYVGEFFNWSEHGRGTMTYRSGRQQSGIWVDGELTREDQFPSPSHAPSPMGQPAIDSMPELDEAFGAVADPAALERELQSVYDQVKGRLQGRPKDSLVTCQRAWIKYHDEVRRIAESLWLGRADFDLRIEQIEGVITMQRTRELDYILKWISGRRVNVDNEVDNELQAAELAGRLRQLSSRHHIAAERTETLKGYHSEASRLSDLAGLVSAPAEARQAVYRTHLHMEIAHLLKTLDLLIASPANAMPSSPVLESMSTFGPVSAEEQARLTKETAALQESIRKHWNLEAAPPEVPQPLPTPLANALQDLASEVKSALARGATTPEGQSFEFLTAAGKIQEILSLWRENAAEALPRLAAPIEDGANPIPNLNEWWKNVAVKAEEQREKADAARHSALEKLRMHDAEAALARLREAAATFPLPGQETLVGVSKAYARLIQDKSLRAADAEWAKPTLPDKASLEEAAKACEDYDALPYSLLRESFAPVREALDAASLLLGFINDYEPSGELDRPHPVVALQKMRGKERWARLSASTAAEVKPLSDRLLSLEKLINPKLTEYEALIGAAENAERDGKYLLAAESYRKSYGIDKQPMLLEKARECEGKASGL